MRNSSWPVTNQLTDLWFNLGMVVKETHGNRLFFLYLRNFLLCITQDGKEIDKDAWCCLIVHASIQDRMHRDPLTKSKIKKYNRVNYNLFQSLSFPYPHTFLQITWRYHDRDSVFEVSKWYTFIQHSKECLVKQSSFFLPFRLYL